MRSGAGTTTAWRWPILWCSTWPCTWHRVLEGPCAWHRLLRAEHIYTISSLCLAAVSSAKRRQTSLHNVDEVLSRLYDSKDTMRVSAKSSSTMSLMLSVHVLFFFPRADSRGKGSTCCIRVLGSWIRRF
jgi:hypothetical protein